MKYRIAETDEDYGDCRALLVDTGGKAQGLIFPTIMAFDDKKLAGFIATTPNPDMVVGGPMALVKDRQAPFVAARLAILYQQVLFSMGIEWIVFCADENNSPFGRGMKSIFPHIEPYEKKGSVMSYLWWLDPARQRSA